MAWTKILISFIFIIREMTLQFFSPFTGSSDILNWVWLLLETYGLFYFSFVVSDFDEVKYALISITSMLHNLALRPTWWRLFVAEWWMDSYNEYYGAMKDGPF